MLEETGFPKGYTPAHYRRDADLFGSWLKENYPECLYVGPSSTGGDNIIFGKRSIGGVELLSETENCSTHDLLDGTKVPLDLCHSPCLFSYASATKCAEQIISEDVKQ